MAGKIRPPDPKLVEFLSAYEPRVRELWLATRRLVLEEAPYASEMVFRAYAVASTFTFSGRMKEAFCHVVAYRNHVNLGFNRGAELRDPHGLFEGSGSQIRHIRIQAKADLENPQVREYVRTAIDRSMMLGGPVSAEAQVTVRDSLRESKGRKRT